jgi:DNA-binding MarR family transcriptional regulator
VTAKRSKTITDREYRALATFRRELRAFLHFSEQAAKDAGITPAQHQLLLTIRGANGGEPPTIGEVAEWMKLRHHSAVELVDRAVAAGLLRRIQDTEDQRRQRLVLTDEGERKLASLSALHRDELRRFRKQVLEPLSRL